MPKTRRHRIEYEDLAALLKLRVQGNPKKHADPTIRASLKKHGMVRPVFVDDGTNRLGFGHGTLQVLADMKEAGEAPPLGIDVERGRWLVPVVRGIKFSNLQQLKQYLLVDNRSNELAGNDDDLLAKMLGSLGGDFDGTGYTEDDFDALLKSNAEEAPAHGKLSEMFLLPPFSVLDARQGPWQERKRAWLSLGIKSELGRSAPIGGSPLPMDRQTKAKGRTFGQDLSKGEHKFGPGKVAQTAEAPNPDATGTSIFDPVLCELAYLWFSAKGGVVLDPFAGGSVRGIVASKLGRGYVGIELRAAQVEENRKQARAICKKATPPSWLVGDSADVAQLLRTPVDLVFTCPPYGDLEVYSDDPRDISTLDYPVFVGKYRKIIAGAVALLKPDRFACVVVGDIRDKRGFYRRFVSDTEQAFEDAGARLYNEAILVTAIGSLSIRAGRAFSATRKLGKTHQQMLVFCKGDPAAAAKACGKVKVELDAAGQFGQVLAE